MAELSLPSQKIQMVDLVSQHAVFQSALDQSIATVLGHGGFINGPEVKTFAQRLANYLDIKHVVPCANGTDALQIALMALGLCPGDEVITTSFNYVAAAEAVALLGLRPVFAEVNENTFNIDIASLAEKITPRTKAIIAVHLFGQACDMEPIMALAEKHQLHVIEDNAQSLGCEIAFKGKMVKAGTVGHIGTTSFFPTKNLGCMGDGGAIFSNDDALATKCRSISSHGQGQRYEFQQIGVNSRLDTLQAAMLNVKLDYLTEALAKRSHWAARYTGLIEDLGELQLPYTAPHTTHSYNQFTLRVRNGKRDALKQFLQDAGVPTMIYYPKPLHLQPAFAALGYQKGDFSVSEQLCQEVLSLPIHPMLTEEQVHYIAAKIQSFCEA